MIEELETILSTNVRYNGTFWDVGLSTIRNSHEDLDRLLRAISCLQSQYPDDWEKRKAAARDHLGIGCVLNDDEILWRLVEKCVNNRSGPDELMLSYSNCIATLRALGLPLNDKQTDIEEKTYYNTGPDYPEQWLDYMSEESAEWLLSCIENGWKSYSESPPDELQGVFLTYSRSAWEVHKSPFITRGLELPDFIDEEEL